METHHTDVGTEAQGSEKPQGRTVVLPGTVTWYVAFLFVQSSLAYFGVAALNFADHVDPSLVLTALPDFRERCADKIKIQNDMEQKKEGQRQRPKKAKPNTHMINRCTKIHSPGAGAAAWQ